MANVKIEIVNLPQIRMAFNSAPRLMSKHFNDAIKKATLLVESQSKMRTPVLTGFLRSSHTTSFTGSGLNFSGVVEPTAKYAGFVHEGTKYMRGQPFLRRGAEASNPQINFIFTQAMQGVLNDIGRMV